MPSAGNQGQAPRSSREERLHLLVAGGVVMVGASGGEFGIRGFVAAFNLDTGKELWRTYTVPAPGEPGSETWPKGEEWKTGGDPVWVTGNYDPETNLAFWGAGNGGYPAIVHFQLRQRL